MSRKENVDCHAVEHLMDRPIEETLLKQSPKLKLAYQFSCKLTGVFDRHLSPDGVKKMVEWMKSVTDSELACFNTLIKTLAYYQEQIANYFIERNNSGFVEGFNSKVKVLKRWCYGLSDLVRLFQCLGLDTLGMARFAPGVAAF